MNTAKIYTGTPEEVEAYFNATLELFDTEESNISQMTQSMENGILVLTVIYKTKPVNT